MYTLFRWSTGDPKAENQWTVSLAWIQQTPGVKRADKRIMGELRVEVGVKECFKAETGEE